MLLTGDSGFYSFLTYLKKYFSEDELKIIPGISSMQLLFARSGTYWQDAKFISLHGRDQRRELLAAVKKYPKVGVLTDNNFSPDRIAALLLEEGLGHKMMIIGENLSYSEERLIRGQADQISQMKFATLSVMLIYDREGDMDKNNHLVQNSWPYEAPGISDSEFIRGQLPMTKEEIRAVTISKLRLKKDSIIYDIGAGTGSITVEAARLADYGQVYAIEREIEGINLITSNLQKFGLQNVELVWGEAPKALRELPPADRVIIGGSGGKIKEILTLLDQQLLTPHGRIVINAITLDTLTEVYQLLKEMNYRYEICQLAITKGSKIGKYEMLKAANPVYIISAERRIESENEVF